MKWFLILLAGLSLASATQAKEEAPISSIFTYEAFAYDIQGYESQVPFRLEHAYWKHWSLVGCLQLSGRVDSDYGAWFAGLGLGAEFRFWPWGSLGLNGLFLDGGLVKFINVGYIFPKDTRPWGFSLDQEFSLALGIGYQWVLGRWFPFSPPGTHVILTPKLEIFRDDHSGGDFGTRAGLDFGFGW